MSKAFIPEIDSKLRLEKDWTFDLHFEYQNSNVYTADGYKMSSYKENKEPYKRTLPAATEFMVSRIYVRAGAKGYSSVTLYVLNTTDKKLAEQKPNRIPFKTKSIFHYGCFWVKLIDFNNAEFTVIEDAISTGPTKLTKGEVLTLRQFKSFGKSPRCWATFEHEDPELSFDGIVYTWKLESIFEPHGNEWVPDPSFFEFKGKAPGGYCIYQPLYYVNSLIPKNWTEESSTKKRFTKKVANPWSKVRWSSADGSQPNFPDVDATVHPLEIDINIPTNKKLRLSMGLPNDNALMENLNIAGGKLTIYRVVEN